MNGNLAKGKKTEEKKTYRYTRYPDIGGLFSRHREIILRDDYEGGNRWMEHLEHDLMRFWKKPEVTQMEHGLYRSFFTDDGKPLPGLDRVDEWPPELQRAIQKVDGVYTSEAGSLLEGDEKNADHNFVRSHSRQVFAYGIAYHMTGKTEYFGLCKAGAEALLPLVGEDGSMYTKQELATGQWLEDGDMRTSQDLAYGMTGMAFYYYLTHDPAVLEKILALKNHIFDAYYHPGKDLFTWLPKENTGPQQSTELVAHLDQLYAYLLWLTPSLPQPHKAEFLKDMENIARMMIERFYSEVYGTFWGGGTTPDMEMLGTDHTDFGHSVKAMWVIYQVGVWTGNSYFMNFARQKIHAILENAFDEGNGSWNRRILPDGTLDKDKEWWALAELDQAASLLALKDPTYLQYVNRTYPFWFKNMVDGKHGEIWHVLDGDSLMPKRIFPKAHCWKNALHSFEHTLFCYLTSQHLLGEPIALYYAFGSLAEVRHQTVTPYLFKGNIVGAEETSAGIRVTFDSLH